MSIKDDIKSVANELSPILAGFKLAVIIIGYFGFGSVAKWIIAYWYPFTRWVWDQVTSFLSLPEFPVIVKDSLTALLFFLPLGLTAVIQRMRGLNPGSAQHRFLGGIFGFFFLFIICKDVIGSVFSAIASSYQTVGFNGGEEIRWELVLTILLFYFGFGFAGFKIIKVLKAHPLGGDSFLSKVHGFLHSTKNAIMRHRIVIYCLNVLAIIIGLGSMFFEVLSRAQSQDVTAILSALSILTFIIVSLLVAIFYAPRKLYITTGAAVAFVLAAFGFEAFVAAKTFMESVQG